MKRMIAAWAALIPRRNHCMIARYRQPIAFMTHHTFAAGAGPPPVTTAAMAARASAVDGSPSSAPNNQSSAHDSERPNTAESNNRYVVSRNGLELPWRQVRRQFRPLDTDDDCGSNSVEDTNIRLPDLDAPMDAGTLLQVLPRGAYTTARTVGGGSRIYQFDYHVKRLALSAQSILENITGGEDKGTVPKRGSESSLTKSTHPWQHHRTPSKEEIAGLDIIDEAWEREMALECIKSTLDAFCNKYHVEGCKDDGNHCEFRIVLLATWERKDDEAESPQSQLNDGRPFQSALYCHVGILPQSPCKDQPNDEHVAVLVHGHGRENALAKDSKWVTDRKKLVNGDECSVEPQPSYEEIILINDDGELLEGTQTNFYVATEDSIVTADEGVLYGTVRDSVLRVCDENDVKVELRPPTLEDLKCASGVFITSASRLVMPVHEVVLGDLRSMNPEGEKGEADLPASYCYPNCETTERIRQWVRRDVETHSTPVY